MVVADLAYFRTVRDLGGRNLVSGASWPKRANHGKWDSLGNSRRGILDEGMTAGRKDGSYSMVFISVARTFQRGGR